MVSKSTYKAVLQARLLNNQNKKLVKIVRLTKSGQPSKMSDDTVGFDTVEQAEAYIDRIAQLNPNRNFQWKFI